MAGSLLKPQVESHILGRMAKVNDYKGCGLWRSKSIVVIS